MRDIGGILAREAPGEIVYHAAWSDASALLFYDDESRYLAMLDPIYFYYSDPYRYVLLRAINAGGVLDRKSTRLNSSHVAISYAVFCLKKKKEIREMGVVF